MELAYSFLDPKRLKNRFSLARRQISLACYPRDATRKRSLCCRRVSVLVADGVCHMQILCLTGYIIKTFSTIW